MNEGECRLNRVTGQDFKEINPPKPEKKLGLGGWFLLR